MVATWTVPLAGNGVLVTVEGRDPGRRAADEDGQRERAEPERENEGL